MTQLGYYALLISLFAGGYAFLADVLGSFRRDKTIHRSACNATIVVFVGLSIASVILMSLLIRGDFSVIYVAANTARDLPLPYKISAFWAGASGSLLLWLWLQVGFLLILFCKTSKYHESIYVSARTIGNFVSIFFLLVLILDKNPFLRSLITPEDGAGLNPLLQHPAMALHPPTLFIGYAAFCIPFAWGFASLQNSPAPRDPSLFLQIQQWILRAWMFLTIGIVLGAWWAYEELGWGGYWAWDPVENSSLMPWLTATAMLHCSRTYKHNSAIAVWLIVLSIITFGLCIFGTFLTRYGLVSSVHAFPEPGLGILFLILLVSIIAIVMGLFIRAGIKKQIIIRPSGYAGHRFIAWNNWILLILTFVILVGTLFPFLSGLVSKQNISLKPDYFTKITAPGGLAILLLLGVCPYLLRYGLEKSIRSISAIGIALAAVITWWFTRSLAIPCLILCAFAGLNLFADWVDRSQTAAKTDFSVSPRSFHLRWYGTRIVHLGMVLVFMGIAGSGGFDAEKQVALRPGESTQLDDFTFTYHGLKAEHGANFTAVTADISIHKSNDIPDTKQTASTSPENQQEETLSISAKPYARLSPSMAVYSRSGKRTSEVDIKRTFMNDVYLALTQVNSTDKLINLGIRIKPLINWIWIGGMLTVLGTLLVQISLYRKKNTVETTEREG